MFSLWGSVIILRNVRRAFLAAGEYDAMIRKTRRTAIIADAHASQLYAAIDGRKTIAELATVTELEIKEILRALDVLLKENSIQIYNLTGQLVENTQLLSAW